ncbi:MAG: sodium/proline symporter [Gemmatimonadetes bacterium]|nr:MAG: sodium/proline symporter [Gemmatimonadota bacterium]
MNPTLIGFILYLVLMVGVGLWTYTRTKTHEDFLLGGRRLNPWVIAFSERASGESAWLLLGLPGAALAVGLGETWTVIGCVAGIIISWIFIAQGLRADSEKYNVLTLPEYFAQKFGKENEIALRVIPTLIILFFYTFYIAAQFSGAGKALNVTFGIPVEMGMVIGAVIIVTYTLMGGFAAVAFTDVVQAVLMLGTVVILPIIGFVTLQEAHGSITEALCATNATLCSWTSGVSGWAAVAVVIGGLSWGFGYMGQPHLIIRYLAMRTPEDAKFARPIAFAWAIPAFTGAFLIGFVGVGLYGTEQFAADPEQIMPYMATHLLPAWLAGIFISGAIAAMMSTADSQILVMTSAITEDIYNRLLGKTPTQSQLVLISRIATLLIGVFAFILAYFSQELVFQLVSYAWSGLGASFGPIILFSLFWKKLTREGVLAGMLVGSISTVLWRNIADLQAMVTERFASFVLAVIAIWVVSLLTQKNSNKSKA